MGGALIGGRGLPPVTAQQPTHQFEITHSCYRAPSWTDGLRRGDCDENDRLQAECAACCADAGYHSRIYRFEDQPLDPRDDLSWIGIDYPDALARLRAEQAEIATRPVYRIADQIGGETRSAYLSECVAGTLPDDAFFTDYICRCEGLGGEFGDGQAVYSWHRRAARCGWCTVLDALDAEYGRQLGQGIEVGPSSPTATADRLRAVLRGAA